MNFKLKVRESEWSSNEIIYYREHYLIVSKFKLVWGHETFRSLAGNEDLMYWSLAIWKFDVGEVWNFNN